MANFDIIEDATLREEHDRISYDEQIIDTTPEPIVIRGVGQVTLLYTTMIRQRLEQLEERRQFGLSNKFDLEFPSGLTSKLAPEEYQATVARINKVLGRTLPLNLRWLLCGCICCCCTLGLSIWPVVYLNKRARHSIEKIIDAENCNLYHKLGLHWKLQKQMMTSSSMMEYVLLIEFKPKQPILKPD